MISLCDPRQQYLQLRKEISAALLAVAEEGRYILGENVVDFETAMAEYCGTRCAIGVASGSDALHLVLRALGIGPGDEVITTPFTFVATSAAIRMVGATPVFVDIDPHTYNIDPTTIEAAITHRTKAILPVHLYGQPCDMQPIQALAKRHGLAVVEDCAQAIGAQYHGRKVCALGTAGCFSFFPSKNLGCLGDGGMVVTDDPKLAQRIEMLRRHGGKVKYHHTELGMNSRLDEIQAAVLRIKLPHLDRWNTQRREIAYRYNELLADVSDIVRPQEMCSNGPHVPMRDDATENEQLRAVYHQYTIQLDGRDDVADALRDAGIQSFPYYRLPLHLQPIHADLGYSAGDLPVAESLASRCLSLPIYPELTSHQQQHVVQQLKQALRKCRTTQVSAVPLASPGDQRPEVREQSFCLDAYRSLLREFQKAGYQFTEFGATAELMKRGRPFVLLRHDIDMDLSRAVQMAEVEAELGIQASYFFLLRTEHYNLLSQDGSNHIYNILHLGHHLGLHFDCAAYPDASDPAHIAGHVHREAALLGTWFDRTVTTVSFHRPSPQVLTGSAALSAPLLHTYMKQFVEQIHYCSDSRGAFHYGHPLESTAFRSRQPLHLLIHPIWWGETHSPPLNELLSLVERRQNTLRRSLRENCSVFQQIARDRAA